jgi:hypothetical protein
MYSGPLANQGGFALGINAAVGITNAGPGIHAERAQCHDTDRCGHRQLAQGIAQHRPRGEFGQYDVWLATLGSQAVPSIAFGTQTGDPGLGMFSARELPGEQLGRPQLGRRALRSARWTRDQHRRDGSTGRQFGPVRVPGRQPRRRAAPSVDFFIQDNWRAKPNLSVNLGVRYALQMPFSAQNASYSTATLDSLWGVSGYVPGCDLSNPTPETCHLFTPGTMTGKKPEYINLGKGVQAYEMDANNIAPSIGVNWTPKASSGFFRTLLGASGTSSLSAGYSRAFDRRGMNDFTGVFGNNPGLSITGSRNTAAGNLTVPTLFRDGNLGPPPTCPPLRP